MAPDQSGIFRRIALSTADIEAMTSAELAAHIMGLNPPFNILLSAILEYLRDKKDVKYGLFRKLGLLKDDPPAPPCPTTDEAI